MKPSVMCTLGVALIMTAVLSSVAVAAEPARKTGAKLAPQKLPSTIKINSASVRANTTLSSHAGKLKAKLKDVEDITAKAKNEIPALEQLVTVMVNKKKECLNKTFTTADMTAAGCVPQNSLADCEERLYRWCYRNEMSAATGRAKIIDQTYMTKITGWSSESRQIFLEWKEYFESH